MGLFGKTPERNPKDMVGGFLFFLFMEIYKIVCPF